MTVRELILELVKTDMDATVFLEQPNDDDGMDCADKATYVHYLYGDETEVVIRTSEDRKKY